MKIKFKNIITVSTIESRILWIRRKKVMLDSDLAVLYQVETKALNKAVKRNMRRFPEDFMFQLNQQEVESLRFQIGTSKESRGGRRYLPFAFTEQGVAMLSSVLNSERAMQVNIEIIRTFVRLRELMLSYKDIQMKIEDMERKYDKNFSIVFQTLRNFLNISSRKDIQKRQIGFRGKN